jgi:hypothetical protein
VPVVDQSTLKMARSWKPDSVVRRRQRGSPSLDSHAHTLIVQSSLQDTIRSPLASNATLHTVEVCPMPGPASHARLHLEATLSLESSPQQMPYSLKSDSLPAREVLQVDAQPT